MLEALSASETASESPELRNAAMSTWAADEEGGPCGLGYVEDPDEDAPEFTIELFMPGQRPAAM